MPGSVLTLPSDWDSEVASWLACMPVTPLGTLIGLFRGVLFLEAQNTFTKSYLSPGWLF